MNIKKCEYCGCMLEAEATYCPHCDREIAHTEAKVVVKKKAGRKKKTAL